MTPLENVIYYEINFRFTRAFVIYIHGKSQEHITSSCSFVIMKDGLSHKCLVTQLFTKKRNKSAVLLDNFANPYFYGRQTLN